jgi:hypothetical protein
VRRVATDLFPHAERLCGQPPEERFGVYLEKIGAVWLAVIGNVSSQ